MFDKLPHFLSNMFVIEKKNTFSVTNVIRITLGFILVISGLTTLGDHLLDKTLSLNFGVKSLPEVLMSITNVSFMLAGILTIIVGFMIIPRKKVSKNTHQQPASLETSRYNKSLSLKIYPFVTVIISTFPIFWLNSFKNVGPTGLVLYGFMLAYSSVFFVALLLAIISSISKKRGIYVTINILLSVFSFIAIIIIKFPSLFLGLFLGLFR